MYGESGGIVTAVDSRLPDCCANCDDEEGPGVYVKVVSALDISENESSSHAWTWSTLSSVAGDTDSVKVMGEVFSTKTVYDELVECRTLAESPRSDSARVRMVEDDVEGSKGMVSVIFLVLLPLRGAAADGDDEDDERRCMVLELTWRNQWTVAVGSSS